MYLLRLVVDTNCLNAKGRLGAMNDLQRYHDIGAVELIVTSTLSAEIDPDSLQADNARQYQRVGGDVFFLDGGRANAVPGAPLRPSRFDQLRSGLFDAHLKGRPLTRAIRDCLHLDQAQMNLADIFVTNDKKLHDASALLRSDGIALTVASPEKALQIVKEHIAKTVGTDDPHTVASHTSSLGPVILGSTTIGSCAFCVGQEAHRLLTLKIANGRLELEGTLRDEAGAPAVILRPTAHTEVLHPRAAIRASGRGPLLVGREPYSAVVVLIGECPVLAVRTTHTLRVVVFVMNLRDEFGRSVASIEREMLTVTGAGLHLLGS